MITTRTFNNCALHLTSNMILEDLFRYKEQEELTYPQNKPFAGSKHIKNKKK